MTRRILLVNGPNLNLLGTREPELYGEETLADVEALAARVAADFGIEVRAVQSNHEGVLIDAIHEAREDCLGIVINPGAFTHTSVALRDAITGVDLPTVEVHLTNVHAREPFRHHSYISPIAAGVIVGCGVQGYEFAVRRVAALIAR
ncbi:type II 3-dehydroquinate dehydratase [Leucobacter chromiireducens]|uniref:3-dehydroquinate dehydratase n=1 Tax=Leucobacter chromiireducens subsp. chromiireducens TaxID=660067 RepID=A0ABS1SNL8_9MICO|nr:type II 3-dehydroquinate dehydratase [Leucobacter chromiireducens]MBL3689767.1 type II 3-dehydroquinate dehydratase [Leucobacter chromiireducens subsp. chromiireducens]